MLDHIGTRIGTVQTIEKMVMISLLNEGWLTVGCRCMGASAHTLQAIMLFLNNSLGAHHFDARAAA